jgi:hypothetical protein
MGVIIKDKVHMFFHASSIFTMVFIADTAIVDKLCPPSKPMAERLRDGVFFLQARVYHQPEHKIQKYILTDKNRVPC